MKMETIKNYLDSMFANLPNTASVLRAKEELLQMMEDKYTELIKDGKSENEAVGNVIAEFGNLSELAEALGVEEEVKKEEERKEKQEESDEPLRVLTTEDAKGYIKMKTKRAFPLALGIAAFIASPVGPILMDGFLEGPLGEALSAISFFAFIAAGILLVIFGASDRKNWRFVKPGSCDLSMDATKYVVDEKNKMEANYRIWLILGIILCATCWFPAAIGIGGLFNNVIAPASLFVMVATGVFMILYSNTCLRGYKILLALNGTESMKSAFAEEEDEKGGNVVYESPVADVIMGVYWPTVTCIYLIMSFVTFRWGITWLIWPVAGILHPLLAKAFPKKSVE